VAVVNTAVSSLSYPTLANPLTYASSVSANPVTGGLTAPITYAKTGTLPSSGAWSTSSGAISGTATAAGTYSFTVTATDANGATATASVTDVVTGTVSYGALASELVAGTAYSTSTPLGGTPTLGGISSVTSWTVSSGAMPSGMSLNSNGLIIGTPNASGTYSFVVEASNSTQTAYSPTYTVSVETEVGTIAYSGLPSEFVLNTSYSNSPTVGGSIGVISGYAVSGGLPTGMSVNPTTGVISGKPTTAGSGTFTVTATGTGGSASVTLSAAVNGKLTYNLPGTLSTLQSYASAVPTSGGNMSAITSWTIYSGALPPGLTLNSNGSISGTPTAPGQYSFAVMASNAAQAAYSQTYSMTVESIPAETLSYAYTTITVNTGSGAQPLATGMTGSQTYALTSGALPSTLTFSTGNGDITGTPTVAATYPLTVTATDTTGYTATASFNLTVNGKLTYSLPGTLSTLQSYASAVPTIAGITGITSWTIYSGALPPGLTLNSNGSISGTPAATGPYSFAVMASNATQAAYSQTYSMTVESIPAETLSYAYTAITVNTGSGAQPLATGMTGGQTYALTSGALPSTLTFSTANGDITGTPTVAATYPLTVTATDTTGYTATASFNLTVNGKLTYSLPGTLSTLQSYASAAPIVGGNMSAITSWTIYSGALPPGLALNANGSISGTPMATGPYSFVVMASNATQAAYSQTYSMTVEGIQAATLSYAAIASVRVSHAIATTSPTVNGLAASPTFTTLGTLPTGVTVSPSTGQVAGTPTQTGTFNFTVIAKDANNVTVSAAITLVVTN